MRGLKYISWGDTTGYAIAAKAYVRALVDAEVELTWSPMMLGADLYEPCEVSTWSCPKLSAVCNRSIDYDTVLIHTVPEYYDQWIERERRPGKRIFGYTVWELESLPSHWPDILNRLDGVIVPCQWNVEVFRNSGVQVPIHVVPHLSQFEGMQEPTDEVQERMSHRLGRFAKNENRFVFYNIGFWSHRKAPYLAIEAYWRAFNANDPVLMVVKTSSKDITRWNRHWRNGFRLRHPSPVQSISEMAKRYPNHAPLVIIADEALSDEEMLALHNEGDCFVSLTRTEGWGLGAFEAARLGKPIIMTGYGGQLDFLDSGHANLVDYAMVPVHEPTWSANYKPADQWAEPSVSQAAKYMRSVFDDQDKAREQGAQLAERIARDFSRKAITDMLKRVLA